MADPKDKDSVLEKEVRYGKDLKKILKELSKSWDEYVVKNKEVLDVRKEIADEEDKLHRMVKLKAEIEENGISNLRKMKKLVKENKDIISDIVELGKLFSDDEENILEIQLKKIEALKKYSRLLEQIDATAQSRAKSFLEMLTIRDREDSFFGAIEKASTDAKSFFKHMKIGARSFRIQLGDMMTYTNLFGATFSKIWESTVVAVLAFNDAFVDFQKNTGRIDEFRGVLFELGTTMMDMGVSVGDVSNNVQTLLLDLKNFSLMNKEAQQEITRFVSVLERVGFAGTDSAAAMNIFMNSLNMTAKQSKNALKEMLGLAKALGMMPSEIAREFTSVSKTLIKYGKQMNEIFIQAAKTAKNIGISISELVEVGQGFDTFDEAARKVGHLNAILGGPYLNAVQMLRMNEEERVATLVKQFQLSGKNFEQLNRHEKQALAAAAGISDMSVATNLFTKSTAELMKQRRHQMMQEKEIEEQAKKSAAIMDKLKQFAISFAVLIEPLIDGMNWVADGLANIGKTIGNWVIPLTIGLSTFLVLLVKRLRRTAKEGVEVVDGAFTRMGKTISKVASTVFPALGNGLMSVGAALTKTVPGWLAFGATVTLIGAGIGAAAAGLGMLAESVNALFMDEVDPNLIATKELIEAMAENNAEAKVDSITRSIHRLVAAFDGLSIAPMIALDTSLKNLKRFSSELAMANLISNVEASIRLTTSFDNMMKTANEIKPEAIKNTSKLVEQVVQYEQIIKSVREERTQPASSLAPPKSQEVVVKVNDRELGRFVMKVLEDELNLRRALG